MEREAEKKEAELQLQRSIRCVKALLVLSSLRPLSNHGENAIVAENEELKILSRSVADLNAQLIKERLRNRSIRNCNSMEFFLKVLILLSLLTIVLLLTSF